MKGKRVRKKSGVKALLDSVKKANAAPPDGVSVSISPITFVMAVFFVAFGMAYEFVCSLTAVILHEFAHARVAKKLGYALNNIKIMPYGAALNGSAELTPKHEILIAMAGPAVNCIFGLIFAAMWWLIPVSYAFTHVFCLCNIYIGVFNLIPVYPLDGGRILLALLSMRVKRKKAYTAMRVVSVVFGAVMIALFILSAVYALNPCFLAVGLFMVCSALIPDRRSQYYALFALNGRKKRMSKPLETKIFAVSDRATVTELIRSLDPDKYCSFDIYDEDLAFVTRINEGELTEIAGSYGYGCPIGEAIAQKKQKY
ncbi:MAG: M50 family metallopeptidase [Clostridiales bacterium]|nr:M50 family metallopeptidase [Clostridiales bacterium]